MSKLEVDAIEPQSGTTLTLGASGDTITIPSGATFDASSGSLAGTLTTAAQPNITSVGTLTSFASTGIDDNATGTSLTINSDGSAKVDSTGDTCLDLHHTDGNGTTIEMRNNSTNSNNIRFDSTTFQINPAGSTTFTTTTGTTTDNHIFSGGGYSLFFGFANTANPGFNMSMNTNIRNFSIYSNTGKTTGVVLSNGGNSFGAISDLRLKNNINSIEDDALTIIKKLHPVTFKMEGDVNERIQSGFIAQEVEKVLPIVVNKPKDEKDYYTIQYQEIIPYLTKSIQQLGSELDNLKLRVLELENK